MAQMMRNTHIPVFDQYLNEQLNRQKSRWGIGILRSDGKEIIQDTLTGYFSLLNEDLFCFYGNDNDQRIIYNSDGQIDSATLCA